jgi:hypothetical protein
MSTKMLRLDEAKSESMKGDRTRRDAGFGWWNVHDPDSA